MKIVNFKSGLGNQVFYYLMAKYLEQLFPNQKVYGYYNPKFLKNHNGLEVQKVFDIELPPQTCKSKMVTFAVRMLCRFFPSLKSTDKRFSINSTYFDGWWQDQKFFLHNVEKLKFRTPNIDNVNKDILTLITTTDSVSIHIRRGDYLAAEHVKQYGGICTDEYYKKAVSIIMQHYPNAHFFVFSNDMDWVKHNLPLENATFVDHNHGEQSFMDMYLMSFCKANILANSSFSYWGAMLNSNQNPLVIYPAKWFNTHTPDLFKKEWQGL